jgi:hypothetical protein
MNYRFTSAILNGLAALLLSAGCSMAQAQYLWIDDKGVKQLSDRPPPPNIPEKRILKAPGKPLFNPNAPAEAEDAATSADNAAPPAKALPTLAERNADYNKRKTEAAAAEKKSADEARQKADIAANCDAARKNQMALDNGVRMSEYDKSGERRFVTDEQRVEMAKKNRKVLVDCK